MFYGKICNYCYPVDLKEGFDIFFDDAKFHNHFDNVDSCILWAAYKLFVEEDYKFIWKRIIIKGIDYSKEFFTTDKLIEAMWDTLTDVNVDENDCIEQDWFVFTTGTEKEYIWHWIDERHSKGVGWIMYNSN